MVGATITSEFPHRVIELLKLSKFHYLEALSYSFANTDFLFQQMVIENAREKILSNKSLQEKLAENINKFLTR